MVLLASNFDKSKYLKATDLDKERKFRIKSATDEVVGTGNDKEHRLVLWLTNDGRGLVLNRTNLHILREEFGDLVDSWIGKVIAVYPTTVDFRGKLVPGLRVRIPPPKQPAAATSPQPASSGNGAGAAAPAPKPAAAPVDPELVDEPQKPLREELDDELLF
jgi:hypothetical protein